MIDYNDKPLSFGEVSVNNFDKVVESKDLLKVKEYATALAEFIGECDTPMTIGVQGDWGIGKTSMLNTVKAYLQNHTQSQHKNKVERNYGLIWVNTWHYSMFGQDDYLGLSVVKGILEQLKDDFGIKADVPAMEKALGFAKNLIKNTQLSVGGFSVTANDALLNPDEPKFEDISQHVRGFKKALEELITSIVVEGKGNRKVSRIVFFIDDLDRVKPIKALELLEVLKNFLDIENCVFLLAVDYEVVQIGMEQKYGVDLQKKSGKSFFDKIIQLPFTMPSTSYDLANYIKKLLIDAKIPVKDDQEAQFYDEITTLTVGRNPRSVKRVVNYAKLIRIIRDSNASKSTKDSEKQRQIIYALVCMQIAWPEIFAYFAKSPTYTTIKQIENWEEQAKIPFINKLYDRTPNLEQLKSNISAYFDSLFELLDSDNNGYLGKDELKPVWDALQVAKLTATTDFKEPFDIFSNLIRSNLNGKNEIKGVVESLSKSKWVSGGEVQLALSGKRYATLFHNRKQIGSMVTLKNRPLIFRLNLDEEDLKLEMAKDFSEQELVDSITPLEETSLTGFGETLIDLSKMSSDKSRIKFLNRLYNASMHLIKKSI